MKLRQVFTFALPALLFAGLGQVKAAPLTYTLDSGNLHATASFTPVSGGFMMEVTNTESNTASAAQAISQIQFKIGGALGQPTTFTKLTGNVTTDFTSSSSQTFTNSTPGTATLTHWQFSTPSTSVVDLFNAGGPGGKPTYLIAAAGSTPDSSLTSAHAPSFVGPVDFFFADSSVPANLTTSEITGVSFAFGTGPDTPLDPGNPPGGGGPGGGTPEPASLTLFGVSGGITLLTMAWRRRRNSAAGLNA